LQRPEDQGLYADTVAGSVKLLKFLSQNNLLHIEVKAQGITITNKRIKTDVKALNRIKTG
jgi:hypothetical protein